MPTRLVCLFSAADLGQLLATCSRIFTILLFQETSGRPHSLHYKLTAPQWSKTKLKNSSSTQMFCFSPALEATSSNTAKFRNGPGMPLELLLGIRPPTSYLCPCRRGGAKGCWLQQLCQTQCREQINCTRIEGKHNGIGGDNTATSVTEHQLK